MMNNANEISHQTKLYGFVGEEAGQSSLSASLNRLFKAKNKDAMMIPMNIRRDDFFFTLSNLRKSHVNGAVISSEFVSDAVEILDVAPGIVKRSGMCDILVRDGEKLIGDLFSIRVLTEMLKDNFAHNIAIIGISPYAKAFSFFSCGFNVSYFHDDLEALMKFTKELEIPSADINRIAEGMEVDFSPYDAVLDFSELQSFDMVTNFAQINFDMKTSKQFSALRTKTKEYVQRYVGYDDMIEELSKGAYNFFEKKGHLKYEKPKSTFEG